MAASQASAEYSHSGLTIGLGVNGFKPSTLGTDNQDKTRQGNAWQRIVATTVEITMNLKSRLKVGPRSSRRYSYSNFPDSNSILFRRALFPGIPRPPMVWTTTSCHFE